MFYLVLRRGTRVQDQRHNSTLSLLTIAPGAQRTLRTGPTRSYRRWTVSVLREMILQTQRDTFLPHTAVCARCRICTAIAAQNRPQIVDKNHASAALPKHGHRNVIAAWVGVTYRYFGNWRERLPSHEAGGVIRTIANTTSGGSQQALCGKSTIRHSSRYYFDIMRTLPTKEENQNHVLHATRDRVPLLPE